MKQPKDPLDLMPEPNTPLGQPKDNSLLPSVFRGDVSGVESKMTDGVEWISYPKEELEDFLLKAFQIAQSGNPLVSLLPTPEPKDIDAKPEKCLWCSGVKTHKEWCLSNYPKPADKQDDKLRKQVEHKLCKSCGGEIGNEPFLATYWDVWHTRCSPHLAPQASETSEQEGKSTLAFQPTNTTFTPIGMEAITSPSVAGEPPSPTPQQSNSVEQIRSLKLWGAITSPDGDGAVGYVTLGEQAIQQLNLLLEAEYRRGYNDNARDCMCDALPMSPHHHLMDDGESRHIKPDIPLTKSKGIEQ